MPVSSVSVDATIRHQAMLEGLKRNHEKIVLPYLQKLDKKLRLKLTRAELTTYNRTRLEALIKSVGEMTENILSGATSDLTLELNALAKAEAAFESKALDNAVQNPGFNAKTPAAAQVRAAINAAPLSVTGAAGGQLLKPFMKGWTKAQRDMVEGAIRTGAFTGATNAVILKTIRGTASAKFKDGLLGRTAAQFRAVVHTGVQHVSSVARMETYAANSDLVKKYRWSSTLDNKTTEICQSLDGREFEVGNGPVPPAHVNCRSSTVPVLDEDFKFLREGATRASMGGPVPANQTYFDWLKKQPASFQDSVLGKTRGALFRNGGLSAEEFAKLRIDQKTFKPLTLKEMEKLVPEAFKRAGIYLDPKTGMPKKPPKAAPKPAPKVQPKPAPGTIISRGGSEVSLQGQGQWVHPSLRPKYKEMAEPLSLGKVPPVTKQRIQEILGALPQSAQKRVAQLNEFLAKYQTGSIFSLKTHTMKNGYRKGGHHATVKKYAETLGPAPDGTEFYYGVYAKGRAWGFTGAYWNLVVTRVPQTFRNFAKINPRQLHTVIKNVIDDSIGLRKRADWQEVWKKRTWNYTDFARKNVGSLGQDAQYFFTWVHEIGHQIHFRAGTPRLPNGVSVHDGLTKYSATNHKEFFAEHFTAWLMDREALNAANPKIAKWIDEMVDRAINDPRTPQVDF